MDLKTIQKSLENGAENFSSKVVEFLVDEIGKYKRANLIEIEGWKGASGVTVTEMPKIYILVEYRKDKHSGEITSQRTEITKESVEFMEKLIGEYGNKIKYRQLITRLILSKSLPCSIDAFNGGTNRAKYYFPLYYYPLKVLESQKKIKYGGGGIIEKLEAEER